jgi:CxxC motif-containing protein
MTELICIVCPKGCHLHVDEQNDYAVTGNSCEKGAAYGKKELVNPTRVVTSTVKIHGTACRRLPVKTDSAIPKAMVFDAMRLLDDVDVAAPVAIGDIIIENILSTGVNFVATKNIK